MEDKSSTNSAFWPIVNALVSVFVVMASLYSCFSGPHSLSRQTYTPVTDQVSTPAVDTRTPEERARAAENDRIVGELLRNGRQMLNTVPRTDEGPIGSERPKQ